MLSPFNKKPSPLSGAPHSTKASNILGFIYNSMFCVEYNKQQILSHNIEIV